VVLAPLVDALTAPEPLIPAADAWAQQTARHDVVAHRVMTAPGVGPITALSFQSVLDPVARFRGPGAVSAYAVPHRLSRHDARHDWLVDHIRNEPPPNCRTGTSTT
jgi:transposase